MIGFRNFALGCVAYFFVFGGVILTIGAIYSVVTGEKFSLDAVSLICGTLGLQIASWVSGVVEDYYQEEKTGN